VTGDRATATEPAATPGAFEAASSAEWDAIVAAAEDEGKATIYSSQGVPELTELETRFEDEYDMDVVVVRGLPQDLVPRIEVERQTGRGEADVYVSAHQQWVNPGERRRLLRAGGGTGLRQPGLRPRDRDAGGNVLQVERGHRGLRLDYERGA